jgi:phosphatidylglycerol:prolipoprotein diacylglycerol transferase
MWYRTVEMITLGPLHIRVWGMFVGAGIFAGLLLTSRLARARDHQDDRIWTLGIVVAIAGVVGSRVLWALQPAMIAGTLAAPWRAFEFWQPGLALIGGVLLAIVAGIVYARRSGLAVRDTADLVAPGLGLGIAIGRLGCFLTGLHPGRVTGLPWGIYYLGALRHPIPLYESLLGLGLLALGLVLLRRRFAPGVTALVVAATYLVGRSLIDLLRAPGLAGADPRLLGGLTLTQGLAMVMGPLAVGLMVFAWRTRPAEPARPAAAMLSATVRRARG